MFSFSLEAFISCEPLMFRSSSRTVSETWKRFSTMLFRKITSCVLRHPMGYSALCTNKIDVSKIVLKFQPKLQIIVAVQAQETQ